MVLYIRCLIYKDSIRDEADNRGNAVSAHWYEEAVITKLAVSG